MFKDSNGTDPQRFFQSVPLYSLKIVLPANSKTRITVKMMAKWPLKLGSFKIIH